LVVVVVVVKVMVEEVVVMVEEVVGVAVAVAVEEGVGQGTEVSCLIYQRWFSWREEFVEEIYNFFIFIFLALLTFFLVDIDI
jgi:hypothetical protein